MKTLLNTLYFCFSVSVIAAAGTHSALAAGARVVQHDNPAGGQTVGGSRHAAGPNGGGAAQRGFVRSDAEGNVQKGNVRMFRTPNDGQALRFGNTVRGSDGSVQHQSGVRASGDKGSLQTSGGYQRDAEGNLTQNRDTTMTNAQTGNSYQGNTQYNKDSGVTHTATCFDASGAEIACPTH